MKQLENFSDEEVVLQVKRNPYYQAFRGLTEFQQKAPCDATELVYFRKRIGVDGVETIFRLSVKLPVPLQSIIRMRGYNSSVDVQTNKQNKQAGLRRWL